MASQSQQNKNQESNHKNKKPEQSKNLKQNQNPFQFALDSAKQQDTNPFQFALDSVQQQNTNPFQFALQQQNTNPFQFALDSAKQQSTNPFQLALNTSQASPPASTPQAIQRKSTQQSVAQTPVIQRQNALPEPIKGNMEAMGGVDLSDVTVHRNSSQPAQLQAHAFAQGADIHLGPGQERHLPHEAWHVVQQKQGRVKPTVQLKGKVNINDDQGLEQEADIMGQKAIQGKFDHKQTQSQPQKQIQGNPIIQSKKKMGETPFKDGYQLLFQHKDWHETANAFEKYLGSYAYNHSDAQGRSTQTP